MPEKRPENKRGLKDETGFIGPYRFVQHGGGQRLTADSVLLVDFILPLGPDEIVADLGTGTGAIPLMLAWRSPVKKIIGVEIDNEAASAARENMERNGLCERVEIIEADYRDFARGCPEEGFSVVVSNPPYMKAGSCRISPVASRAVARSEVAGGLKDLLAAAACLMSQGGRIAFIYPVERVFETVEGLRKAGLRPVRLRFVHTKKGGKAKLFLVEARRKGELTIEEPVYL